MKIKNFKLEIDDLIKIKEILHKNTDQEIQVRNGIQGSIWFESDYDVELYLKPFLTRLIIVRVNVGNTRKGAMTSILEELIKYCKSNNFNEILIQSALTEAMINFALKNGFKPVRGSTMDFNNIIIGDYLLKL